MKLDAFLRLTNADDQLVEGESTDLTYSKNIELIDFSLCSGTDAEATLGEIGGDTRTQLIMERWAKNNAARLEQIKQREEMERQKEEQERDEKMRRVNSGFQTGLQKVASHVAGETAKQTDKTASQDRDYMGFQIKKDVDSASPDLFQAYCSTVIQPNPSPKYRKLGQFASAEVTLRKMFDGKPRPYLFCSFHDLVIDSYNLNYDSGRTHMVETVTFKFVTYRMKYQSQTGDGKAGKASDISGTMAGKSE